MSINATGSSLKIGFLQASGIIIYILLFATAISFTEDLPDPPIVLGIASFLTAFVFSAVFCGSMMLAYPATQALRGNIRTALETIAWSAFWLLVTILVFLTLIFTI